MAFASISAKTNDHNVIIVAVARVTNGDGVVNIPKKKRERDGGMKESRETEMGKIRGARERERDKPLSANSNVVAMRTMRHVDVICRLKFARGLLIVYLGIKAASCMDRELHVCGWLTPSFSFRGNVVERWREREVREIYCFKNGISRNIMLRKSTPLIIRVVFSEKCQLYVHARKLSKAQTRITLVVHWRMLIYTSNFFPRINTSLCKRKLRNEIIPYLWK